MSKGCGCQSGFLRYIKPPSSDLFYVACCIHDDNYEKAEIPRKEADRILFMDCIKIITKKETNPWKTTWLVLVSLFYYISVRIFGGLYYGT